MPSNARRNLSLSRTSPIKKRIRGSSLNNLAISHCFISSREKTTILLGLNFSKVIGINALPNEPVPPVIKIEELFNIDISFIFTQTHNFFIS